MEKELNEVPCVDCITLSMCKNIIYKYEDKENWIHSVFRLCHKCSILNKFVVRDFKDINTSYLHPYPSHKVYKFLKTGEIE